MQDMSPTQANDPHDTMIEPSTLPSATPTSPPSALPRPAVSSESSQLKFVPADAGEPLTFEPLPPEIANADICIAPDGSFVETSSGAAARELKRRYDQYLGVGKDVRSPYAITAFVNQHGKQMYRVGHRESSAPAASGQDAEDRASTSLPPSAGMNNTNTIHMKRRSRMSVHSFLPVSVFKSGMGPVVPPNTVFDASAPSRSPPTSRRLRKTRSIPNGLASSGAEGASAVPPPQPTGRPHAHSVSSADAFAAPLASPPQIVPDAPRAPTGSSTDFFADVMSWSSAPASPFASSSSSLPFRHQTPVSPPSSNARSDAISNPFGRGVSFESPSWRSPNHLGSPPVLREMQSFESGLTARADYLPRMSRISRLSMTGTSSASDDDPRNLTPPPGSATPPVSSSASSIHSIPPIPESPILPSDNLAATTLHSRYSTALFDVLQTYRGLPTLDKLVSAPGETTIRLSLRAEDSVAPRDDPRFVIWAEVATGGDTYDELAASSTDLSSASQGASRRRAGKERVQTLQSIYATQPSLETPSLSTPAEPRETKRMLVAATIERWIAQLTSELNYDELLIFFLTYRTYISAVDLGHLLICRFHWALGEATTSRDEMVRRIVRVRTFTAIRYWLLTFFDVDFVPNRELRTLFAEWLNSLRRDPILTKHRDALKIVRQLRKVILDCKDAHMRKLDRAARKSVDRRKSEDPQIASFADSNTMPRPSVDSQARSFNDPEDFDIDFDFEEVTIPPVQDFGTNGAGSNALDLVLMRQPLHMSLMQYGKQSQATVAAAHPNVPISPFPHNTISRVFVNTIGRLGRWKRVLNSRGPVQATMTVGVDVSAFDVEANETGDLLLVKGGVEQYLRLVESQMNGALERPSTTTMSTTTTAVASPPAKLPPLPQSPRSPSSMVRVPAAEGLSPPPARIVEDEEPEELPPNYYDTESAPRPSMSSYNSLDEESLRSVPIASRTMAPRTPADMDVVSIDDLDLSDLSSDENLDVAPPPGLGLKKATRKLPTRRDFEFVRQSMSSVSSMGIRTRESMLSRSSILSSSSEVEVDDGEGGEMGGPIQAWQINAILDSLSDEEESGDVEAALRRLEGQINQDKVKEKQSKVDQWIQSMAKRQPGGQSRESVGSLSDEEDYGQVERRRFSGDSAQDITIGMSATSPQLSSRSSMISISRVASASNPNVPLPASAATSPKPQQLSLDMLQVSGERSDLAFSDGDALTPLTEARPLVEDAVPLEILQSRVPSRPSTSAGPPDQDGRTPQPSAGLPPPPTVPPQVLRRHHSFVLNYRAETLMQHLSMIDRELFLNINFEELITPHAVGNAEDANILDWSHFLRERARLKAEGRGGSRTSALTAVRGRFNLLANFVMSEIVLTHPSERALVINKFIRLAWKAYLMKNFTSLVAIIAGLRSEWVAKAKQQAFSKIGTWEARMLRDLTDWTASAGDFKHIRQTVDSLVEARSSTQDPPMKSTEGSSATTRSRAASDSKPPTDPACIPFFGVYLAQLHHYSSLPDLVDPTAPHEPVGIDPVTNTFESPAHPEVFSTLAPLPPSMQLEPLINVHKQRLISGVVKSLVAGQHLAAKVQYPLDKKIFQKCLKLRGLDADTLERALMLYAEKK
ncbi:ras GEF [Lentinus brumalis]|uniref:Ras GEF n=1 Tax=Lentinus brumalis TaxID=2498619 RepID=A0A371D506_9APHY|nr:ras GEF [Polyporus brumalis]